MSETVHIFKKEYKIPRRPNEAVARDRHAQEIVNEFCNGKRGRDSAILKALDMALESEVGDLFTDILASGTVVYRARIVKDEEISADKGISIDKNMQTTGFDEENCMEAPLGMSNVGRNNIAGMSYLYVAGDSETACIEMKAVPKSIISLAEIEVMRDMRLFDMSSGYYSSETLGSLDYSAIYEEIVRLFYRPVSEKKTYEATQIISDYIRKMGYDGIVYNSFYTYGKNYTIFNSYHKYFKFLSSRLLAVQGTIQYYWDFNDNEPACTNTRGADYLWNQSKDVADFIIKKLNKSDTEV